MQVDIHEDEVLGKAYDARLTKRLLAYLKPYRAKVFLAFGLIFATAAVELVGPYLTKVAIDDAIIPGQPDKLPPIIAAFIGALVVSFFFRYAQNYIMQVIGQSVMY